MSVQWHATGTGQRAATPSADPVAAERVVLGDGDDVYGGMVLATIIVLSATVTGMVLLAAGVWWLVGRLP